MPLKLLNIIIAVSVLGIGMIFARDTFVKSKTAVSVLIPTQSKTSGAVPTKEPEIPCQSDFFDFNKGTVWKYRLSKKTADETKKTQIKQDIFTSTIIEASPSSIIIESQFVGEKEKIKSTITCRKSGIYGLPFPISQSSSSVLKNSVINFDILSDFKILPPDTVIEQGGKWTNSLGGFGIDLVSRVSEQKQDTITIASEIQTGDFPLDAFIKNPDNILSYTLARQKGLTDLALNLDIAGVQKIEATLKLLEFKKEAR